MSVRTPVFETGLYANSSTSAKNLSLTCQYNTPVFIPQGILTSEGRRRRHLCKMDEIIREGRISSFSYIKQPPLL